MDVVHAHNLNRDVRAPKPHGIRIGLRADNPFVRLLGQHWERYRWYATPAERDQALRDMAAEHLYSRRGDRPALILEPVERKLAGGDGPPLEGETPRS